MYLTSIISYHVKSNLGSDPLKGLKGVNQGVPPPEKCFFFENPVHVFVIKDLLFFFNFFALLPTLIVFYNIKNNLGSDPLKGVNQGVPPPPEHCFLRILIMFLKTETSVFCNVAHLDSVLSY